MIFIYAFMVQMIISPGIFFSFFILSKFWFSRFLGRGWGRGRGGGGSSKGQKIVHKKLCPLHLISKEPYIIWLSFMVHKCKLMISPGVFFQNFDFSVKGHKMVQNEKRFCLFNTISQEPYIIWLSFVVGKCKMIISPGVFFIFSKFWFFGLLVG